MAKQIVYLIFVFLFIGQAKADTLTVIYGTNLAYVNQVVELNSYKDLITKTVQIIAQDTVDSLGNFKFSFELENTQLVQVQLGIYNAIMYVEPKKTYQVAFPEYKPKTKADILNPYFKPVEIYLGIVNRDTLELNYLITDFNEQYHRFIDQHYYAVIKNPRGEMVDSLINNIENTFGKINNEFFQNYRLYKYAWLKYISVMRDYRYIVREYFNDQELLYQNPAYMDLFNQIFTNYLSFYMTKKEGERIFSDIAFAKSPKYVKESFSNNLVLLNDTLQELVLLKGLQDAFYTKDFPIPSLLITLDSIANYSNIKYHCELAKSIRTKVLKAKVGFDAPQFLLYDADSVLRKNKDYLSNYVYLNFISIESYSCQEELVVLKQVYEKHTNDFKVVTISIDNDFNRVVKYFNDKEYHWILLDGSANEKLITDFKVRAYPSYCLINPEGKIEMSPAPSPSENFEWYFFTLLQGKKSNRHR
ncbi:MAG: redoxin domain-containing protein [Salinivirgaceae bacterium]|nr:redoxin domain-containing protein [Salinivirgaceae bacterium]